jgi:hypothetical protein
MKRSFIVQDVNREQADRIRFAAFQGRSRIEDAIERAQDYRGVPEEVIRALKEAEVAASKAIRALADFHASFPE